MWNILLHASRVSFVLGEDFWEVLFCWTQILPCLLWSRAELAGFGIFSLFQSFPCSASISLPSLSRQIEILVFLLRYEKWFPLADTKMPACSHTQTSLGSGLLCLLWVPSLRKGGEGGKEFGFCIWNKLKFHFPPNPIHLFRASPTKQVPAVMEGKFPHGRFMLSRVSFHYRNSFVCTEDR